jgi:hypothetical protein
MGITGDDAERRMNMAGSQAATIEAQLEATQGNILQRDRFGGDRQVTSRAIEMQNVKLAVEFVKIQQQVPMRRQGRGGNAEVVPQGLGGNAELIESCCETPAFDVFGGRPASRPTCSQAFGKTLELGQLSMD